MRIQAGILALTATAALGQSYSGPRLLSESAYRDRLQALWLSECLSTWTGLQTEGHELNAPFLTDAAWGTVRPYTFGNPLDLKWYFSPWLADDNMDIEYVYQHLMVTQNTVSLSPQQIADGWAAHINRSIWVSDAKARALIGRGVLPPVTGMGCANSDRLAIDAQLTTELFGAFCPGNPGQSLDISDLAIRNVAAGYSAHAAQFYVVLNALATQVPSGLSGRDQGVWLVSHARSYIPDTSKTADIIDFVLADFLANPDINDWELTRDRVALRYQTNAAANGFVYRDWVESSVNLATGIIALLYGHGDFRRTVIIGTLSGWDSDDGTATMGALLGLMNGTQYIRNAFPGQPLSDNFDIFSTRDNLPAYVVAPNYQDTFTLMSARAIPLVRQAVIAGGGRAGNGFWLLPPVSTAPALQSSPTWREGQRSANNAIRRAGGIVSATAIAGPNNNPPPASRGVGSASAFANGVESNFDGRDENDADRWYYTSQGTGPAATATLQVTYDRPLTIDAIRFIEGDHFSDATSDGGYFTTITFEALIGGVWTAPAGSLATPLDPAKPFQLLDFVFASPQSVTGVRIRGTPGGTHAFVTCSELEGLAPAIPAPRQTFDLNADGKENIDDLYAWEASPTDLDGDGAINATDRLYLQTALRWTERTQMMAMPQ